MPYFDDSFLLYFSLTFDLIIFTINNMTLENIIKGIFLVVLIIGIVVLFGMYKRGERSNKFYLLLFCLCLLLFFFTGTIMFYIGIPIPSFD